MAKERKPNPAGEEAGNDQHQDNAAHSEKSAFLTEGQFYAIQAIPGLGAPLGATLNTPGRYNTTRVAGVAGIRWIPTFGVGDTMSSPINQAAQSLYNKVQDAMNNRNLPFAGIDLLKVILSLDSVHILYRIIHRAVNTLGRADIANSYLPQALFSAYHLDYASFRENKAQIREDLATWRDMITKRFPLPKVFKFIDLHAQMTRFIYGDNNSRKAQFYVCSPQALWSWDAEDTSFYLSRIDLCGNGDASALTALTWTEIRDIMDSMLNAMFNSTDFQRIIAALNTTFGTDIVDLPDPIQDTTVEFVYDEGFNNCLQNATVYKYDLSTLTLRFMEEDVNIITCLPEIDATVFNGIENANITGDYKLVNATHDTPGAAEMTNYMRWHSNLEGRRVISLGTEIITGFDVWRTGSRRQDMFTALLMSRITETENPQPFPALGDMAADTAYALESLVHVGDFSVYTHNLLDVGTDFEADGGWYDERSGRPVEARTYPGSYRGLDTLARLSVLDAFDALPIIDYIWYQAPSRPKDYDEYELAPVPFVHWRFCADTSRQDITSYHRALLWSALLE